MSLAAAAQISDQDTRSVSSTQGGLLLGQTLGTNDGRKFAYGLNGNAATTALSPGKLMQGALTVTNNQNNTGVAAAIGATTITYTTGATAITVNQYAQGYFIVNASTGAGQCLSVVGNTVFASSGSGTVTLGEGLIVATTTSSKFSLQPHPYSAVVISSQAASTAIYAVGVPQVSIPAANYGWFQTYGPASVLANGTIAVGAGVIPGATTDGSVDAEGTSSVQPRVGYMLLASVSTEYRAVYLSIN